MDDFVSVGRTLRPLSDFSDFTSNLTFGNKFLDDATGGIFPDDLIIVTAKTGGGKTEVVTQIAQSNALNGHRVHYFALEAHDHEIHLRLKFKKLSSVFFMRDENKYLRDYPNYLDWLKGDQQHLIGKYEVEVDEELKKELETLFVYYRKDNFDITLFESYLSHIRLQGGSSLIVIDHLHYFDFSDENENRALKETVKQIKDLVSFERIPTILVVQLRKQDKRFSGVLPGIEDIHGSSDIAKIATKILVTGPAYNETKSAPWILPTYMQVLKNRYDGSRCQYIGITGFDSRKNKYAENYYLGKANLTNDQVDQLVEADYPRWAKR